MRAPNDVQRRWTKVARGVVRAIISGPRSRAWPALVRTRSGALLAAVVLAGGSVPRAPFHVAPPSHTRAPIARLSAEANDQRLPAGRIVDGELRVELDVVEFTWLPRGPRGPSAVAAGFAEHGHTPQMPGPLFRMRAGTPVRVSVRNTLDKPVELSGLSDRTRGDTAVNGLAAFRNRERLVLAPGEARDVRFTPTSAVTSFYYAHVVQPHGQPVPPEPDAGLVGAFVVDPAGTLPLPDERIFVITMGFGPTVNGLSWPYTERLRYTQGDTVRWRVINPTSDYHPMHLHGFYFTVDERGDAQTDTVIRAPRPLEVTEGMRPFSTMRLSWTAERAGNWLFHCHLLLHSQDPRPDSATMASTDEMTMDHSMAGLIMGITVAPRVARATAVPTSVRRLDLWTGTRPGVFGDAVGYGFVLQRGASRPAPDSIIVPGSPLVLRRDEPTRIVVHNRLPFALAVHWHGMELQSYYDGVAHWSGAPGGTRAPIAAGDSISVYITPPRAGTFMYHTHGEAGAELAQGLYGTLVVLEKGHTLNAATDRLFVLASRGATIDADVAINGRGLAPAEHFEAGTTYRLRFTHISMNDVKKVRLLKDGRPVLWRPLARDGATLPDARRAPAEATQRIDVGETFDFEWTPMVPGVYVLEVATDYLIRPSRVLQRVAFGVGPVPAAVLRVTTTGTSLPVADLTSGSLVKLSGAYVATGGGASGEVLGVWSVPMGLAMSRTVADVESPPTFLIPLADGTFVPGTNDDGLMKETLPAVRYRIDATTLSIGTGATARSFTRLASLKLADASLARFAGRYDGGLTLELKDGVLASSFPGGPPVPLTPISPSRFIANFGGTFVVEFASKDGKVVSVGIAGGGLTFARLPDK